MKTWKYGIIGIFAIIAFAVVVIACGNGNDNDDDPIDVMIDELTLDNYPRVDGSTSTDPLNNIIAARLLDYEYQWLQTGTGKRVIKESGYVPN